MTFIGVTVIFLSLYHYIYQNNSFIFQTVPQVIDEVNERVNVQEFSVAVDAQLICSHQFNMINQYMYVI